MRPMKLKSQNSTALALIYLVFLFLVAGCGGRKSSDDSSGGGGSGSSQSRSPPPIDISNLGSSVKLVSTNAIVADYSGHPVNLPEDASKNVLVDPDVQMTNSQTVNFAGKYAGYLTISYTSNGVYHEANLWTGSVDKDIQYNYWYTDSASQRRIFHGVFEDRYALPCDKIDQTNWGGIILVIDQAASLGDGQAPKSLGESVWYRNFPKGGWINPDKQDTRCWFISLGPYDCRAWVGSDGNINPTDSVYPNSGYKMLVAFVGLDAADSFSIE